MWWRHSEPLWPLHHVCSQVEDGIDLHEQSVSSITLKKGRPGQSYPMDRMCFGQYQVSSAVLGWLGDGDCYLKETGSQVAGFIHVITSSISKAASIHIAVLLIFDRDHHMLSMYMYMTVVADHLSLCPRVYIANGWDSVDSAKNIARKKNCSLDNLTGRNGSYSTSQVLLCICRVPSSSSSITLSTFRCICMPQGVGQC